MAGGYCPLMFCKLFVLRLCPYSFSRWEAIVSCCQIQIRDHLHNTRLSFSIDLTYMDYALHWREAIVLCSASPWLLSISSTRDNCLAQYTPIRRTLARHTTVDSREPNAYRRLSPMLVNMDTRVLLALIAAQPQVVAMIK